MVLVREDVRERLKLIAAMLIVMKPVLLLVLSIKYQMKQIITAAVSRLLSDNLVQIKVYYI